MGLNSHAYRATMGYWITASDRGQGVCSRALRLLSQHALDDLEVQRVDLITDPDNIASQVSPRRSGSSAKASFALTSGIPTDAFATR